MWAKECNISYSVLYSIASVESHPDKDIGYPYLISFNSTKDARKVDDLYMHMFLDRRTLDCKNRFTCERIFKYLKSKNITNVDLGAFQINYRYHKTKIANYFILSQSYKKACDILMSLKHEYGWSWDTVGKYHSFKKKYAKPYAYRVYKQYMKINKKLFE